MKSFKYMSKKKASKVTFKRHHKHKEVIQEERLKEKLKKEMT